MAPNESTCLNKGTFSDDDVTLKITDDKTELTSGGLEVTDEIAEEKSKSFENAELNFDSDLNEEPKRTRKLTEKAKEERVNRLRQKRTTALSAVSRKRTDITKLMNDPNNLYVVKTELTQLDILCQQFADAHDCFLNELEASEDRQRECGHFAEKENDIFEYRKRVANWITSSEERFSDHLDGLSEMDKRSQKSHASQKSRLSQGSRASNLSRTSSLARAQERARVAELLAEKAMFQKKVQLEAAEKEFELDLKIAKAQARERALSEIEEEQKRKALSDGQSEFLSLPEPKYSLADRRPPPFTSENTGSPRAPYVKIEKETRQVSSPFYRAFTGEIKTEIKKETPSAQKSEEELLNEVFELQQAQIQSMVSSQQQLATAVSLPQPEVPKFTGNPMNYKTFIMAFDARIQSRVPCNADRLYYLDQHLLGEPKDLIGGCLHIEPDEGYVEARKLLEKEYGDPYKISNAFMQKLSNWPIIKYDDGPSLKRFSFFLIKCKNAMKTISHMTVLNHPPNMQSVVQKLPGNLQMKWREFVVNSRRKDGKVANFGDLTEFAEHAAESASDPIYSRDALIAAKTTPKSKYLPEDNKRLPPLKSKVDSFAVIVDSVPKPPQLHGAGSSTQNTKSRRCPLCEKSHDLEDCEAYKRKSVDERRSFLTEKALCFACYGKNHRSKSCTKKRTCKKCNKPHPTLLHVDGFSLYKETGADEKEVNDIDKTERVNNARVDILRESDRESNILLQSILPVVVTQKGVNIPVKTYAVYDNGSAGCFITEHLKARLEAESTDVKLQLGTMHGNTLVESAVVKDLVVTDLNGESPVELPRVYTRNEIPADHEQIPTPSMVERIEHLKEIAPEIAALNPELEIGLLIGNNCPNALLPLRVVPNKGDGPFAVRLRHGWTVSGPLHLTTEPLTNKVTANRITVREVENIKEIITPKSLMNMFELDFSEHAYNNLPEAMGYSQEDKRFLTTVTNGVQLKLGRYEIPLPFRHSEVNLPNNREQAVKRALWQRKKMLQNEMYRNDYAAFFNDMFDKGYAEEIPQESSKTVTNRAWYIPHHGVYHPKKPEKIRVVFDCSAKFGGTSLNDQLLQGPYLTNSLVGVLTRFRQEPVAFMADIEAMFYQVQVPPEQRDFLRFLWWPGGDLNAELKEYRMTVHPFGAVSSPSCANYALRKTADDNEEKFGNAVADTLRRNFYVDDCLRSVSAEATAKEQIKGLRKACTSGGFHLTKFICNRRSVLESIPENERSKDVKALDLQYDNLPIERALGVQWCVESDTFKFRITVKDKPITRRGILSVVSSIYDPLGFAAPFTLMAKKLLQDLCKEERLGWDDELPEAYCTRWEKWRNELPLLERMAVPRCVRPTDLGEIKSREIHIFADASTVGYGSVAYQRLCDNEGHIHCSFLMGKARLAPIKAVTIPRLELTAATLSVRLGEVLKKELDDTPDTVQYHTDSTTVLRYIGNDQRRFQVFVANRVQTIRNFSSPKQWKYVDTKENPADDASRGIGAQTLVERSRWIKGPAFLWQPEQEWPQQPLSFGEISNEDPEIKKQVNVCAATITKPTPLSTITKLIHRFSSWYLLKKAAAVYMRVKAILKERVLRRTDAVNAKPINGKPTKLNEDRTQLTIQELEEAELAIIRYTQSQSFVQDIKSLGQVQVHDWKQEDDHTRQRKSRNEIRKNSSLYRLDPLLDNGLLRVGGRLSNADIPEESKHPLILPRKGHVTSLIIRHTHEQLGHARRGHVLAKLREKYWIIGANSAVRQMISSCVTCRRHRATPKE